jgi:hypothetical protein
MRLIEPEAAGYLVAEYVRCGKPGCKCHRGEKHGPYWYLHFRRFENGAWRQRKRYVALDQVAAVRAWLSCHKARERAAQALLRESRRLRAAVFAWRGGHMDDAELKGVCDGIAKRTFNAQRA